MTKSTAFTLIVSPLCGLRAVSRRRSGAFTLVELLVVVAILGILVTILVPAVTGHIRKARRLACAANLHAIGMKMIQYAHGNRFQLPAFPSTHSCYHAIGHNRTVAEGGSIADNARAAFKLVLLEYVATDAFVCPSVSGAEADPQLEANQYSFASSKYMSYSFQNQKLEDYESYTARPTGLGDPSGKAIMADSSPMFKLDPATPETYDRMIESGEPTDSNSHNHGGSGQNVLFLDRRVVFCETPFAGVTGDNIYTPQTADGDAPPFRNDRPYSRSDSELVP